MIINSRIQLFAGVDASDEAMKRMNITFRDIQELYKVKKINNRLKIDMTAAKIFYGNKKLREELLELSKKYMNECEIIEDGDFTEEEKYFMIIIH